MSISTAILRELGAEHRTFRTVKGAMLWYAGQLAARLRVNRDYEWGSTPRSEEARHNTNATFAAIAACLRNPHPTDPQDPDEAAVVRYHMSGERLLWLLAWYEGDGWGDGTYLATKAEMSRWAFTRRCRKTERTLRRRLEQARLLEEG